jgi:enoyl-CoA hydratase
MSEDWKRVRLDVADHLATVTLARPDARNALDPRMIVELREVWSRVMDDSSVRAAIVTGEGSVFCAGFDLGTTIPLMSRSRDPQDEYEEAVAADLGLLGQATLRDLDIGKPLVAAVQGHAIAGGFELMLAADVRVVASGVRLGLSEVQLGLIPGMGGTARLARQISPALAAELLLTGDPIQSERALAIGLVNDVVPLESVLERARALGGRMASNGPLALVAARRVLRASGDITEAEALAMEAEEGAVLAATADAVEGPKAFMEKRSPVFQGR